MFQFIHFDNEYQLNLLNLNSSKKINKMENDKKHFNYFNDEILTIKAVKKEIKDLKKSVYFFILMTTVILSCFFIFIIIFYRYNSIFKNDSFQNLNNYKCSFTAEKLYNRTQPLEFENEFFFFIELLECNIPFSLIRFGDGENSIMKGKKLKAGVDKWYWSSENKNFQKSLIESSSICLNNNSFIGIPCKNWIQISKSILSFSNCSSSKYMTYATVFINKNYKMFQDWILKFINSSNRWKIILVANSNINKSLAWADKFFPVPDHLIENWDIYGKELISKLSIEAKNNNLIFFISAGPAANIIVSILSKINNKNTYIDFGSSIEFITKGFSTRPYSWDNKYSKQSCETFTIHNKILTYS
jgi:hypothetical protein